MPRLSDQILFLIAFGPKLVPQLGHILASPQDYHHLLPQDHRAVRRALSRMLARGEIKRNHELTIAGKNRIAATWPQHVNTLPWDQKWRVVMFDIPERYRGLRAILRRFLTNLGFTGLQRSFWITPFAVAPEVNAFLEASRLSDMVLIMEVDKLWGPNPQELAEKTWKLGPLTQKYQDLAEDCAAANVLTKTLQQKLVKAIFTDPFLPPSLQPQTLTHARDKALKAFSVLEKA